MSDAVRGPATVENLRGGNFDPAAAPVATVATGDDLVVDTISPYSVGLLTDASA